MNVSGFITARVESSSQINARTLHAARKDRCANAVNFLPLAADSKAVVMKKLRQARSTIARGDNGKVF